MRYTYLPKARGFTLIELLVTITILAVLAALVFSISKRAIRGARTASEVNHLRQCGQVLNLVAGELGHYPVGWDATEERSWADAVRVEQQGEEAKTTQLETLWSPLLERDIPLTLERGAITHFAGNPAILTDAAGPGAEDPGAPRFKIRLAGLRRPSEQVLLCAALPESSHADYHAARPVLSEMADAVGDTGGPERPQMDAQRAAEPMRFPATADPDAETFGAAPDFFRFGKGKGQFLFVDGHIQSMAPSEHRERHWASNY